MNILVSTQSTVAVSDVRATDVAIISIVDGLPEVKVPLCPTLGADPSRIALRVFGAPHIGGAYANTAIRGWIEKEWTDFDELEALINFVVGDSWYRAKLMDKLDAYRAFDALPKTKSI